MRLNQFTRSSGMCSHDSGSMVERCSFEGRMLDLIVSVPDRCLFFYLGWLIVFSLATLCIFFQDSFKDFLR